MHVRTVTLRARGDNFERVLGIFREMVIPASERQDGFNAFVVMSNREEGKIVGCSYWETEADMLASERGEYFQEQISRVIPYLSGPPHVEHFEVNVLS